MNEVMIFYAGILGGVAVSALVLLVLAKVAKEYKKGESND